MRINLKQKFAVERVAILFSAVFVLGACTQTPAVDTTDYYNSSSFYGDYTQPGQMSLNSSGTQLSVGQTMQFYASNGRQPYVYTVSGVGSVDTDSGLFYAGMTEGVATITVRDIQGRQATASVYVTANGLGNGSLGLPTSGYKPALTVLATAYDGSVSAPAGAQVGCPVGTSVVGSVANPLGSPPRFYGSRFVCAARSNVTAMSQVYADITVTPPGLHGMASCPAEYTPVGSVMDCGNNICMGEQLICAKIVSASATTRYVTNFYVTQPGVHAPTGAGCSDGAIAFASTVDCGGNSCSGYQTFCKSF